MQTPVSVNGGKVWEPPRPMKNSVNWFGKVLILAGFIVLIWFSCALMSYVIDASDGVEYHEFQVLQNDNNSARNLTLWITLFLMPEFVLGITLIVGTTFRKGILLFLAIVAISGSFIVDAYQYGQEHGDNKAILSEWMEREYNYGFIEFIENENVSDDANPNLILVSDLDTGEEKFIRHYEQDDKIMLSEVEENTAEQVVSDTSTKEKG